MAKGPDGIHTVYDITEYQLQKVDKLEALIDARLNYFAERGESADVEVTYNTLYVRINMSLTGRMKAELIKRYKAAGWGYVNFTRTHRGWWIYFCKYERL